METWAWVCLIAGRDLEVSTNIVLFDFGNSLVIILCIFRRLKRIKGVTTQCILASQTA